MHYLVATDSVHTTAAACDYLEARLDPDDAVTVLTVAEENDRAGGDALNVATARLAAHGVETERRDGDPAEAIRDAAAAADVDAVVMGPHKGVPGESGVGETAIRVLSSADVPVVVVPLSDLDSYGRS